MSIPITTPILSVLCSLLIPLVICSHKLRRGRLMKVDVIEKGVAHVLAGILSDHPLG